MTHVSLPARKVLKLTGVYLLVGENLECTACKKKWPSWNRDILSQLDIPHRKQFPALLTYRYACDESVVLLLRDRTTGNSPSQLARKLQEEHRRTWMQQTAFYLAHCQKFVCSRIVSVSVTGPPKMLPVPKFHWLQTVYCSDVLSRLDEMKATITSVFGRILKMDSTKQVCVWEIN